MIWLLRVFGLFLLVTTFLPLLSTGKWYVRWWDFPRLQLAVLLFLALSTSAFLIIKSTEPIAACVEPMTWMLLLAGAFFWQCSHIIQFSSMWSKEIPDSVERSATEIKFMVANLNYENQESARTVIRDLEEENADVLLLIEVDERWNRELVTLRDKYKYHYEYVRGEGLGISIWSQLEMRDSETKFLISDRRASLWTSLVSGSGEVINFVGVHPTPPGLLDSTGETRRDSRVRDAELILVAKEIASRRNESWVVAGDFNDVAWSHTTRLFKRTSGLLDPRVGRSYMGTFIAQYPPCRCPIDHVFLSEVFAVKELSRKRVAGSDHFAVIAVVTTERSQAGVSPRMEGNDKQDAREIIEEGKEDAKDRDVYSPSKSSPDSGATSSAKESRSWIPSIVVIHSCSPHQGQTLGQSPLTVSTSFSQVRHLKKAPSVELSVVFLLGICLLPLL